MLQLPEALALRSLSLSAFDGFGVEVASTIPLVVVQAEQIGTLIRGTQCT